MEFAVASNISFCLVAVGLVNISFCLVLVAVVSVFSALVCVEMINLKHVSIPVESFGPRTHSWELDINYELVSGGQRC